MELVWINAVAASEEQRAGSVGSAWAYPSDSERGFYVDDLDVPGADRKPLLAVPAWMAPENLGAVHERA